MIGPRHWGGGLCCGNSQAGAENGAYYHRSGSGHAIVIAGDSELQTKAVTPCATIWQ